MNYNATDLTAVAQELQSKLEGLNQAELQQLTNIPSFDQFGQQASALLPDNFINVASNGAQQLLSPTNFANKMTQGLNQIAPQVQQQATGLINAVAGKTIGNIGSFDAAGALDQLDSLLSQMSNKFSIKSADQMISALTNSVQGGQIGNIQSAMQNAFSSASQLTPKGIRDLANPSNLTNKINETVSNAKNNITSAAQQMALDQANNPGFSNSGQLPFQQLSSPSFSGSNENGFQLAVRLTVYWSKGSGTDYYTAKKLSSTGRILAEGISAAVDPVIIPYLSRMDIPYVGTRLAVDTGGAVKARRASGGRLPIVDVYFEKKETALAFTRSIPTQEVVITVYPPKSQYKYAKYSPPTYGAA